MASPDPQWRPVRIEQELHVLDAATLLPTPRAAQVLARLPRVDGVEQCGAATLVALRTRVCAATDELRQEVARLRGALIGAARAEACALASCGQVGGSEVSAQLRVLTADGAVVLVRDAVPSVDDVLTVATGGRVSVEASPRDSQWLQWVVEETARGVPVGPVVRRPRAAPDSDERRLRADVPPHHG